MLLGPPLPRYRPYTAFGRPFVKSFVNYIPVSPVKRLASPWRDFALISNRVLFPRNIPLNFNSSRLLPMAVPVTSGADRRQWRPRDMAVNVYGQEVTPTDVSRSRVIKNVDIDPETWERIHRPLRRIDWRPRHLVNLANGPWWYGFANPEKMVICLERKMRREVMHALGLTGKVGQKRPHYNQFSRVRC